MRELSCCNSVLSVIYCEWVSVTENQQQGKETKEPTFLNNSRLML